jgi:hypothetical protein
MLNLALSKRHFIQKGFQGQLQKKKYFVVQKVSFQINKHWHDVVGLKGKLKTFPFFFILSGFQQMLYIFRIFLELSTFFCASLMHGFN